VNFKTDKLTWNSIKSTKLYDNRSDFKIVIVDNSHSLSNVDFATTFSNLKILTPEANLGFAKANNLAARQADSEYLCFLNPDTIVNEDFLTPIIEFISSNPDAGACAPMLVYEDGSYQSSAGDSMGLWYEFLEATMLIGLFRKQLRKRIESSLDASKPLDVGWVSGACMFIKQSVFESVGGFTEEYFLNYEDIDLCKKLESAGYRNYIFPGLKCTHLDHKSFDSNYELLVYSRYQSRLIYARLHYDIFTRWLVRSLHLAGLIVRLFLVNIQFHGSEKKSRRSGYWKSFLLYMGLIKQ
jgi:GT2 family glycosyltransferase